MKPHSFSVKLGHKKAPLPWLYCAKCGLLLLKNAATIKAQHKACPGSE